MSVLSVHSERPFGRFIPLPAFRLKITANGLIWTISSKDERHFVGIVRLFSARVWQMAKNIVICCDGTGNEFGDQKSNVVKLYKMLVCDETKLRTRQLHKCTTGMLSALFGVDTRF